MLYPSDITDKEWLILKDLVAETKHGRPRDHDIRQVLNAIFYVSRTGCQWRYIPKEYPAWQTCYGYFRRFTKNGTWEKINDTLRTWNRLQDGKSENPSVAIIDSQTVQNVSASKNVGYDAAKKKKVDAVI